MVKMGEAVFAPPNFYGVKTLQTAIGFVGFRIGGEDEIVLVGRIESHASIRCNKSDSSYDVDRKRGPRPQYFSFFIEKAY